MDSLYSLEYRSERLIVLGRLVLAGFSLLAIWLEPTEPARYAQLAYTCLIIYLGYAVLLIPLAWRSHGSLRLLGIATHVVDLFAATIFMYFTNGPASPFFFYLTFALLCAALRWRWRGTLWTALAALVMFMSMGVYSKALLQEPMFELDRFIIRSVYLVVMAALLSFLSIYGIRMRRELAEKLMAFPLTVMDAPDVESMACKTLENAADTLGAPRALITWAEPKEPWLYLAEDVNGKCSCRRTPPVTLQPPVAEMLTEKNFLCLDAGARTPKVLHTAPSGSRIWHGSPLHPDLQASFAIRSVLCLRLQTETLQGCLFFLDKRGMTLDDLTLGELVARQVTDAMDQFNAQQRLRQMAATEERLHLARDLHDGLLQALTAHALQLEVARRLLKRDPQAALKRLVEAQEQVASEQQALRSFIQGMSPALSTTATIPEEPEPCLAACLKELNKRMERQWDLRVVMTLDDLEEISSVLAHEVYYLIQEALINTAKHAQATTAHVRLGSQDDQVHIVVADDGGGFPFRGRYDLAALTESALGPASLKARIVSLAGEFIIDSTECGARLKITLPLRSG